MWLSSACSAIGSQLGVVAVAYEVYRLTGSSLEVGLVSLAQLGPILVGALLGGSIADAVDRKKLLVMMGVAMTICAIGLAVNAHGHRPSLLAIFLLASLYAGFQGMNGPASTAILISIVNTDAVVAANALRQVAQQFSLVVGPAVGGILLAAFNVRLVFVVNVALSLIGVGLVLRVGPHPPVGGTTRFGWQSISEGFHFLRGRQAIQGCFIADLNATILGMPTSLFPALGLVHFHGGARAVGFLYAAPGVGAFAASGLSGWTGRIRRPGYAVCIAITVWGIAIAAFGLAPWLFLALVLLAIAGAADVISAVFRGTILQTEAPDRLRGRLSSIQQAVVNSGPRLGSAEAGLVASLSSTQVSVVSGGLGCIVGIALVARLLPKFLRYELAHGLSPPAPSVPLPVIDDLGP